MIKDWGSCVVQGVATLKCIPVVMNNVIVFSLMASGVVALFFIIWSGARYVTSAGDAKKIEAARKTFIWALVGLVVILFAFFLLALVSGFTGVDCIKTIGFDNCK